MIQRQEAGRERETQENILRAISREKEDTERKRKADKDCIRYEEKVERKRQGYRKKV